MKVKRLLENYISMVIENAKSDRKHAQALLDELKNEINEASNQGDKEKNERAGETATKYLRTIQKSNKQIIDVIKELRRLQQNEDSGGDSFSVEGEDIYEDIEEEVTLEEVE